MGRASRPKEVLYRLAVATEGYEVVVLGPGLHAHATGCSYVVELQSAATGHREPPEADASLVPLEDAQSHVGRDDGAARGLHRSVSTDHRAGTGVWASTH